MAEADVQPSTGSAGDSYHNALAETINGLYKAEVVDRRSWRTLQDVELATLEWVGITTIGCSVLPGTCRRSKRKKRTIGIWRCLPVRRSGKLGSLRQARSGSRPHEQTVHSERLPQFRC
ncbi:integrase core domain-containing protein [Burkholderia territorii]|uniref:integrase core domain-containing protein n=1 Tax=Burkholderia territorii TaxID=1503055 RepID=UPI0039BF99D5